MVSRQSQSGLDKSREVHDLSDCRSHELRDELMSAEIPHQTKIQLFVTMLRIRVFETAVAELYQRGEIRCPVHLYVGQEAIAAGVCAALRDEDHVYSTHRSHGHYLAKGGDMMRLMAEIFGKATGASGGFGGSMHVIDEAKGFMGSSAIVAGTIPIACGDALASQTTGARRVTVAFFGDGATDEGVFYESVNVAVLYKLPILFVCENNGFSTHMPNQLRQSNPEVAQRLKGFNLLARKVDGNDSVGVLSNAQEMVGNARSGNGPALLECVTYRWLAHVGPDVDEDVGYRRKQDIDYWKGRCPIQALRSHLEDGGTNDTELGQMETEVRKEVDDAVEYALRSGYPL